LSGGGWFDETLVLNVGICGFKIIFTHVGCNLYSSTKTVLNELEDRIVIGMVIVFDEWRSKE